MENKTTPPKDTKDLPIELPALPSGWCTKHTSCRDYATLYNLLRKRPESRQSLYSILLDIAALILVQDSHQRCAGVIDRDQIEAFYLGAAEISLETVFLRHCTPLEDGSPTFDGHNPETLKGSHKL